MRVITSFLSVDKQLYFSINKIRPPNSNSTTMNFGNIRVVIERNGRAEQKVARGQDE
jgi:hypothetical protein